MRIPSDFANVSNGNKIFYRHRNLSRDTPINTDARLVKLIYHLVNHY